MYRIISSFKRSMWTICHSGAVFMVGFGVVAVRFCVVMVGFVTIMVRYGVFAVGFCIIIVGF